MTTLPTEIPMFSGGMNLTDGNRSGFDAVLHELFEKVRADIVALEDGDQLDVDMTPYHYTPDAGVPEASDVNDLAAHFGGIDNQLGTLKAQTGFPEIYAYDNGGTSTLTLAGQSSVFVGTNLVQSQAFASVTIGASLTITAEEPGTSGNSYSVEVVDSGGGGLAVTYAAGVLSIDLGGATPDEDAIATAINAGASSWTGILRADSGGGAAFGTVASTSLTGGTGTGLTATIGGSACTPTGESGGAATSTASITDTSITVTNPNLAPLAAGDVALVYVESNGIRSQAMSLVLA